MMPASARNSALCDKLFDNSPHSLSDIELLALLIDNGGAFHESLSQSIELLKTFGDLRAIFNSDPSQFLTIPGLNRHAYLKLQAARELCRRNELISLKRQTKLNTSLQSARFMKQQLRDKPCEVFAALFLDHQQQVLSFEELFYGSLSSAVVFIRPLIEKLVRLHASAVIVAHNHPSGHCAASEEDIKVTQQLQKALMLVEGRLLDHFIVADNTVYSLTHDSRYYFD